MTTRLNCHGPQHHVCKTQRSLRRPDPEQYRNRAAREIAAHRPLAGERLGIPAESLEPFGHFKAKVSLEYLESLEGRPDGKLILVTAISPTPAGEGKTTTTVGLGDALNQLGKRR